MRGRYGRLPTRDQLLQSIVDEHVLCLKGSAAYQSGINIWAVTLISAHLCLDHKHSLGSHIPHKFVHIDIVSFLHALQHGVQCDVCASAPHPRTTVHQDGLLGLVTVAHTTDKLNKGSGELGDVMIWPAKEVILDNWQWDFLTLC